MDKIYLFISQTGDTQTFITDSRGYLKKQVRSVAIAELVTDSRLTAFEEAIFKKIKKQHQLEAHQHQVRLVKTVGALADELTKDRRILIYFNSTGRPQQHVPLEREDKETDFYWEHVSKKAYEDLKTSLDSVVELKKCKEIYIDAALFKKNGLFYELKKEFENRIVTDPDAINRRNDELRALWLLTAEEIEKEEARKAQQIKEAYERLDEKSNFAALKLLVKNELVPVDERIAACKHFLKRYQISDHTTLVEAYLKMLEDEKAWEDAKYGQQIAHYLTYIEQYTVFKQEAIQAIKNLETNYQQDKTLNLQYIKRLEEEIEAWKVRCKALERMLEAANRRIDELEQLISGTPPNPPQQVQWGKIVGFAAVALVVGLGAGLFFTSKGGVKPATATPVTQQLQKRVDELIETRIYPKQDKIAKEAKKVSKGTDESIKLLAQQEDLTKQLFQLHQIKFDLLYQVETKKLPLLEAEKEIIKLENEIQ